MKQLLALFFARNKEYYRDRASLIWSFVMPPLIVGVVALAFADGGQPLFKVGLSGDPGSSFAQPLRADYIRTINYSDHAAALIKIQHHQLDLLLAADQPGRYWINPTSQRGQVLEQLLLATHPDWQRQEAAGRAVRYVDWVIPGILGMNIMFSGLFGIGYVIVRYRKNGVLKRLQATPATPFQFLTAQVLSRLIIMMIVSALVYVACDLFLDFIMLGRYLDLLLIALVGNIAILSLGLIVASRLASEELANGLLNFFSFPMLLLSEVWFSLDGAPAWLSQVSQLLPLTHLVQAARSVMLEGAGLAAIAHHLWAMLAMAAIFLGVSAVLFRWR
ncbi:ABC transporter permease [Exilibacterium tricleocarpae]|uniref:Transport permease protein n=1 Tax=Exilibacterium tricleocarpae TaxID=2591008 RepID=A0A545TQJ3_9GAMM|nr:ABC transporter permease [Exilibacterium tricleocarpae]TQV79477.1 ABC transporter permease [Exilibacterium tricleocarpae]